MVIVGTLDLVDNSPVIAVACTLWALRVNSSPMEELLTVPHSHCTMVNGDEALQLRAEEVPVLGALTALAVALMFFEEMSTHEYNCGCQDICGSCNICSGSWWAQLLSCCVV